MKKRVFVIVLDSFGIGELPDAGSYGDAGSNTLSSVCRSEYLSLPNLTKLGLFNIDGTGQRPPAKTPAAAYCRAAEASKGKDTTTGHWEIAGLISEKAMPTYPDGFPEPLLDALTKETGYGWLCNKPYSGTQVIRDYGKEQLKSGKMIVYTSSDSVFQVAANVEHIPLEELYAYCRAARKMLVGEHGVGRVIARPYVGTYPDYTRTSDRHDFSIDPPGETMLDSIANAGMDVLPVGKIYDIFAGRAMKAPNHIVNNADGMKKTSELALTDFRGLCFTNLVDFDMLYGHRNDVDGYAKALTEFDTWLGSFLPQLREDDALIITADHGCDPSSPSTDHSREYIPVIIYGSGILPGNLGTKNTFADIGRTVCELLGVPTDIHGSSFAFELMTGTTPEKLSKTAEEAMKTSYAPYSGFNVGCAAVGESGKVYTGCNIENAAYPAACCAERTAVFKAVSEGERSIRAIAVVGGKNGTPEGNCFPCGVCRQVLNEFCPPYAPITVPDKDGNAVYYPLSALLPHSFGKTNLK